MESEETMNMGFKIMLNLKDGIGLTLGRCRTRWLYVGYRQDTTLYVWRWFMDYCIFKNN